MFMRWGMASGVLPPPLVDSSSDDQSYVPNTQVSTDSDNDIDGSDNDIDDDIWTRLPVRRPDGSYELRMVNGQGRRVQHYLWSARDSVVPYEILD